MKPDDIKRRKPCLKCGLKSAYSAEVTLLVTGLIFLRRQLNMNYAEVVLMKPMKDIIPTTQHHYWKPKYLNRLVSLEMRRRERYKDLRSQGILRKCPQN